MNENMGFTVIRKTRKLILVDNQEENEYYQQYFVPLHKKRMKKY